MANDMEYGNQLQQPKAMRSENMLSSVEDSTERLAS